jgi:transposase
MGIDMAKDKFDYCAHDSDLNVLCKGKNVRNERKEFEDFVTVLREIRISGLLTVGMESTGIYHLPLYNHLSNNGFHIRILNGLEVRGMKRSRIRKTTNDIIDAESIARYLMVTETKESSTYPKDLENLGELITAYDIVK